MWQQQWPDYSGAPANNGVDWGAVAQQWLRNKEMYEQWQKQQYEQHLQMVAAAQAAQMAQAIDPSVVTNPPPPPPLPNANESVTTTPAPMTNDSAQTNQNAMNTDEVKAELVPKQEPNQPESSQQQAQVSNNAKETGKTSLFAAYDHKDLPKKNEPFGVAPVIIKSNGSAMGEKSHKLPLWLRDGLEKIKQEKQKKLETKPAAAFTQQAPKSFDSKKNVFSNEDDDDEEEENSQKSEPNRKDSGTALGSGRKGSKFSDSTSEGISSMVRAPTKPLPVPGLTVEEKQEIQINIVKIWMTEILLEVTNHVMESIAKEEFQYQKDKIVKQKLNETKASLNIAYGDDDESDDDSDEKEDEEENIKFLKTRGLKRLAEYEKRFQSEMARLSGNDSKSSRRDHRSRSRSRSSSRHHKSSRRHGRSRSRSRRRDSSDDDDRRGRRRRSRSRSPRSSRRDRSRSNHKRSSRNRRSTSRTSSSSRSRSRDKKSSRSRHHHKSKRDRRSRSRSSSNRKHRSKRDRSRSRSSRSSSPSKSKSNK